MQKPFNKTREHFHVPILLVIINFFIVAAIYYAFGYSHESFSPAESISAFLAVISLLLALFSLFSKLESLTKITYILSSMTVIYIFWG